MQNNNDKIRNKNKNKNENKENTLKNPSAVILSSATVVTVATRYESDLVSCVCSIFMWVDGIWWLVVYIGSYCGIWMEWMVVDVVVFLFIWWAIKTLWGFCFWMYIWLLKWQKQNQHEHTIFFFFWWGEKKDKHTIF